MSLFATKLVDEYGNATYNLTGLGYGALVALMLVLLILACYLTGDKAKLKTKHLVFSAVAMALAMITSFLKLFEAPMGGSVTLFSMLFICCIGYWYGLRAGIMTGVAYGLLQLISDPYIISLPQMITDYILAFGALGLSGIFCNKKNGLVKGYIVGVLGRYLFAFLSGLIFFGMYAEGSGMSAPVYSLAYNGSYLGCEAAITLIVLAIPAVNKAFVRVKQMAVAD
ncbi:energy-coupled thiamine transporter ThiT [Laedolimicola ammoniilytica]|uniref:Energy-coupled thiamine transporter ThiT n=1 Tax=Laedolimicola ammoniilytica TaxID=2981771 RepID=A0ABT2RWT5_9FIRM|nr:energy-coupled thiamine transporter ThiT [Laedolimicola ammoniilytica]MCU6696774.1 energy-coupled thiamine transporter ThiT [Laedolimicola ammoniilytica]SCH89937.1 Thiamine ECF transporter S component ThiT [uncultured Clostridium sp.]